MDVIVLYILVHRMAFIIGIVLSGMVILLPSLFPHKNDQEFSYKTYLIMIKLIKIALITLVFTGVLRYHSGLGSLFAIKIIFATVTIIVYFFVSVEVEDEKYQKKNLIRFLLFIFTALIGLSL